MDASTLAASGDSNSAHRRDHRAGSRCRRGRCKGTRRVGRRVRARDRRQGSRGRRARRRRVARRGASLLRRDARGGTVRVARGDAVALTRELVRIDSRNPSLVSGAPGAAAVARALADVLEAWGFRVDVSEAAPGRPNVTARLGASGGRSLLFNGHLDVVGIESMTHPAWDATEDDGRIYGRGSTDMKAGVAAMCAAAAR